MRFLRLSEVLNMTGLSRSSVYRKQEAGTFPKSVRLDHRSVAWVEEEIHTWMQQRIDDR